MNIRLGPHKPPRISCGRCGTRHHYDAAAGEYQGHCRDCSGFLPSPSDVEHRQFTEFLVWNSKHCEREQEELGR